VATHELDEGKIYYGFQVISQKELPEYRSTGIRLIHCETGAEVYHLYNKDQENLFSFTFRTPPYDNTGLPHILEHSVLAGSRRFPIKDPFVTLLKGSMQTFLNAFTFPDKTVYPASSMNEKDLFNLMLVYGDAVFSPLLKQELFKQEGHHLEFKTIDDATSGLKIVGVVYNEMQGKYSSPEALTADWSYQSLFPGTPYGFDSGGDPVHIPELTYEAFVNFHKQYYHPSNCKIFLYGNIPTVKHLAFLQENFLSQFSRLTIPSNIPLEPRWSSPRSLEITYPIKEGDPVNKKTNITVNWLTVPVTDPFRVIALEVLSEVLVGNAGSPLRKALVESKLGEDLSPSTGLETELKELVFTAGIRGTDPDCAGKTEALIIKTLENLRDNALDEQILQAAIQRVEFRNREIKGGMEPYALRLMRKTFRGWLHDGEPETTLEFNKWMKKLKQTIGEDKKFFTHLIEEHFVDNPHRSTLIVRPDPEHLHREGARLNQWLTNAENNLSAQEKKALVLSLKELRQFQEEPDPPEMINKIPFLKLQDLPRKVEVVPSKQIVLSQGVYSYFHNIFTNGVIYVDVAFDTHSLAEGSLTFLPLLGKAICGSGLPGITYDKVAQLLSLYTGGFTYQLAASGDIHQPLNKKAHIFFRIRTLKENLHETIDLLKRLLIEADFDDQERVKDLILEIKNEFKAAVIPHGHQFVSTRAGSRLSPAIKIQEHFEGIDQLFFLSELASGLEKNSDAVIATLKKIRKMLFTSTNATINVTAEESSFKEVRGELESIVTSLPKKASSDRVRQSTKEEKDPTKVESLIITSPVGYVAKAMYGARFGSPENGYEAVLSHFLRTGYLWEKIRMRGGAYGAFAVPQGTEGVFIFSSYRDPNIIDTLNAFRDSLDYAYQGNIDADQIEKAIIGSVGKDEKPLDPGEKGFTNFKRKLYGITDDLRQKRREYILSVNRTSLALAAEKLMNQFDNGYAVVMSNEKAIEAAGDQLNELKNNITKIPL
jgi:Zn-dependent M16 (insulinase) family peptidase